MFRTLKTGIAVAVATALEGLQQPVCLLLAFTAVELTILVPLVQLFSFGEGGRLARDSGLAILLVGGMLLAAFTSGSTLARDLVRTLQGSASNLTVLTDPAQLPQAEAVLELPGETQERVAVGMSVAGQIRELQLRLRVRFRLRGQQGQEWIPETTLLQRRDVSYNETAALSKEGEEAMLFRNMRTDLVQQLMRRLAAVKTQ